MTPDPPQDVDDLEALGAVRQSYTLSRDALQRLDKHLMSRLKGMSRSKIQQLISLGGITVNGRPGKASQSLRAGDTIEMLVPPRPVENLEPEDIPLHVLYEDSEMIVINKQADIIVHPARNNFSGTMLSALLWHFQHHPQPATNRPASANPTLSPVGEADARPGVVHRLDRFTTGVILFAKREETHWLIARQWEHRTNLKAYLALVHGHPDPPSGHIEHPIGKHPTIREAMAVRQDSAGRDSLTLYRTREQYPGMALVEFELKTGRTHQIRVHSGYIGHPLIGDIVYGGEPLTHAMLDDPGACAPPAAFRAYATFARTKEQGQKLEAESADRDDMALYRPALHAALLRIDHPLTHESLTFTAPLHEPLRSIIHRLRQHPGLKTFSPAGTHVDLEQAIPAPTPTPTPSPSAD